MSPTGAPGSVSCPNPAQCAPPKAKGGGGILGFDPMEKLANSLREGAIWVLEKLATFWEEVDTPQINGGGSSNQAVGSVGWLQAELYWFVGVTAVLGLLVAAGRLAWHRRSEPIQQALGGFFTLAVVTGCSVTAVSLATQTGDVFSEWIIDAAVGSKTDFGGALNQALWAQASSTSSGLMIILFLLCILASLAQIAMLYIRFAMLGLLVGFLPLAASLSVIPEGKAWFKKLSGWLVAFVLYKPTAACIYAFSFISLKAPDGTSQIVGIIGIILAVAAFPALQRLVMPMVSAVGGGNGEGLAVAGGLGMLAGRAVTSSGTGGGDTEDGPSGARPVGSPDQRGTPPQPPPPDGAPDAPPGPDGAVEDRQQPPPSQSGQDQAPAGAQEPTVPAQGGPAGPSGMQSTAALGAAGAVVGGVQQARAAAQGAAEDATGEGGPDGAR